MGGKRFRKKFRDSFYLVLFEFADIQRADDIDVRIYEVDPRCLGFALCMIDYFFNIRKGNPKAAPFNLFPHDAKFCMMKPRMIYWSVIKGDDTIITKVFPKRGNPVLCALENLPNYAGAPTLCEPVIDAVAAARKVAFPKNDLPNAARRRCRKKLELLQQQREAQNWPDDALADDFARAVFRDKLATHGQWTAEFAPTL